jgi:hypothetical protein
MLEEVWKVNTAAAMVFRPPPTRRPEEKNKEERTICKQDLKRSVQANRYVSANPSCEMDLCLEIQLDTKQQRCILGLAIIVDGPFDDVAGRSAEVGGGWYGSDVAGNFAAARGLAFTACVGHVAGGTGGLAGKWSVLFAGMEDRFGLQRRHVEVCRQWES